MTVLGTTVLGMTVRDVHAFNSSATACLSARQSDPGSLTALLILPVLPRLRPFDVSLASTG
jgi:hypothetical protein